MLKSMTGYGKAVCEYENIKYTVEIKSLNSKQFDCGTRIPLVFKEKEIELRSLLSRELSRGKVDIYIDSEALTEAPNVNVNKNVVKAYFNQFSIICDELSIDNKEMLLPIIMRLPDTLKREREELDENQWKTVLSGIMNAIKELNAFRETEGIVLEKDIMDRVTLIDKRLTEIGQFEQGRIEAIRNRISTSINDFFNGDSKIDKERFEQEMIYYLEKLDITEEKVRLKNHCNYFMETAATALPGKKLGFIAQEILREINTIGSKANDSNIQSIVVNMKDEIEKIKEQLMNVL